MKSSILAMLFLLVSISISCKPYEAEIKAESERIVQKYGFTNMPEVDRLARLRNDIINPDRFSPPVQNMFYFRDPRTNLCFAYMRSEDDHGGPGMASVPCETVAPFLLNQDQTKSNR
jgi:hypothetical protein